ncbi:MAG TPA: exodeoxyribonuclease V subunit gamma [Planctomycetota bacterium]|nr:exodeoxyribonuclease V subunit gamma [Planctomycetota bacterium]
MAGASKLQSRFLLSAEIEPLLASLLEQLASERTKVSPFEPSRIVVPSASVRDWLQREIARRQGIAIQIEFEYLENALWRTMQKYSAEPQARLEQLDHERYRMLVFALLIDPEERRRPELKILNRYLVPGEEKELTVAPEKSRVFWRRAWDCADRLARLIRDYEYHRQDEYIARWVLDKPADLGGAKQFEAMEKCQRYIFRRIIEEGTGLRARLGLSLQRACKTLPQFANEVLFDPKLQKAPAKTDVLPIHLFGIGQISAYHVRLLRWIGERQNIQIYHHSVLANRFDASKFSPKAIGVEMRNVSERIRSEQTPLASWGAAAAAALWRLAELFPPEKPSAFDVVYLPSRTEPPQTLLQSAQQSLLRSREKLPKSKLDQTVEVVACPGIIREVETAYHAIAAQLLADKGLRQSDVTILVSDMDLYRPALQTVFDRRVADARERRAAPLSLVFTDGSVAGMAAYGQALLGMLELPLEGLRRSQVMRVLLNPCFLANLRIERSQAAVWLKWAERLAVYHGFDREDKAELGYTNSRLYSWKLALQRLRLGRVMETDSDDPDIVPYRGVLPYADLDSSENECLGTFCRSIEELLPRLIDFRRRERSGADWIEQIRALSADFLAIPEDRADEALVRDRVLRALSALEAFDAVRRPQSLLPLTAIVDVIRSVLEETSATAGGDTGGIVVAPLHSYRAVPARVLHILGLNEGVFPPADVRSGFDLREAKTLPVDISASANGRGQFLDALLGAKQSAHLSYSCRDLQKDEERYASSLLTRLMEWLKCDVLDGGELKESKASLDPCDPAQLCADEPRAAVTVWNSERVRLIKSARELGWLKPPDEKKADALPPEKTLRERAGVIQPGPGSQTIHLTLSKLAKYLRDPASIALQIHLRIEDEYEREERDEEPFYTEEWLTKWLLKRELAVCAAEFAQGNEPGWQARLQQLNRTRGASGEAPDGVFAEVEQRRFERIMRSRVDGDLKTVVAARKTPFIGAVQIGTAPQPANATIRFPPLEFALPPGPAGEDRRAVVSGDWPLVWRGERQLTLLDLQCFGKVPGQERLSSDVFEPLLFFLALQSGTAGGEHGSSGDWTGSHALELVFCTDKGSDEFLCRTVPAADARKYLEQLVIDACDAECFEHIPFEVVRDDQDLAAAYTTDAPKLSGSAYTTSLKKAILEAQDGYEWGTPRLRAAELIRVNPVEDAFQKVRRRFRLLHQMWHKQPPPSGGRKP